jgi:heme-degrading monooxygenase HmoA
MGDVRHRQRGSRLVHARSTTVRGAPDRVGDGIAMVQAEVLPALREVDGFVGVSMLVDREAGGAIITSAWESKEALVASRGRIGPLRDAFARYFGVRPEVAEWEIAVVHRGRPTPPGAWARVTWTRADRGSLPQQVDFFRSGLVPEIDRLPGFCGVSLLLDRRAGTGVITTVYDSLDTLHASREQALSLREGAVRRMSAELVDVAELEVVVASLHVPETE